MGGAGKPASPCLRGNMNKLVNELHEVAKEKGWWEAANIPEKIALIHSELSEALEDYRIGKMDIVLESGKPNGFPIEIADAVIRIFDLCGYLGIDIEQAIDIKKKYNLSRGYRHGGKKA